MMLALVVLLGVFWSSFNVLDRSQVVLEGLIKVK